MNSKIGMLIIMGVSILLSACSPQEQGQASGTLERDRISLLSTANEVVVATSAQEGDRIKKGQVILQLDRKNQQAILNKAKAQQAQAKANLTKMLNGERIEDIDSAKANLANAKAKLIDAQKHYHRMSELEVQKLVSISIKDNALSERDAAQAHYDSMYQVWQKLTKGNRVEDIEMAQAQFAAAQSEVILQTHKLNELTIVATREGVLDSLPYNLGERVPQSAVVAIIQADSRPYARVYIPEPYKYKVHVGARFPIQIDGVENAIQGTVRWVSVEPAFTPYRTMTEDDRSRFVYLTEMTLPKQATTLTSGIPLYVELGDK